MVHLVVYPGDASEEQQNHTVQIRCKQRKKSNLNMCRPVMRLQPTIYPGRG